jgi:(R)-2-hydroxyacyl-CoA dehydratese activating ATPase
MYYLGIDIGSLSCDAVLLNQKNTIIAAAVVPTGARNQEAIRIVREAVIRQAGISEAQIAATVSTGYGRNRVDGRLAAVTEISCHAKGIQAALKENVQVLIDIGGQDSKAILMDGKGRVADFAMNDKCAAGTGRFLEAMARALEVDILELSGLDQGAEEGLTLSSMCTVFAESEVVSLIAHGKEVKEIVAGMNRAIASRIKALVKRVCRDTTGLSIAMSGGVAHNRGVVRAMSATLGQAIVVPVQPDTVGALGAALVARERSQI